MTVEIVLIVGGDGSPATRQAWLDTLTAIGCLVREKDLRKWVDEVGWIRCHYPPACLLCFAVDVRTQGPTEGPLVQAALVAEVALEPGP